MKFFISPKFFLKVFKIFQIFFAFEIFLEIFFKFIKILKFFFLVPHQIDRDVCHLCWGQAADSLVLPDIVVISLHPSCKFLCAN